MLSMNNEKVTEDKLYKIVTFLLLVLSVFTIQNNNHNNQFQIVVIVTSIILLIVGFIEIGLKGSIVKKSIYVLGLIIVLFIFKFNNFLIIPTCLAIVFINYSPDLMLKSYCFSVEWNLIITFLLSVVGYSPLRNSSNGVITLGFSNENNLGLLITFLSIIFFTQLFHGNSSMYVRILKIVFIALTVFTDYFIIDDKTMVLVFFVFFVLLLFFRKINRAKVFIAQILAIVVPFYLLYESWILTRNFGNSELSFKLNEELSNRLFMWNWYYQKMGINLFPSTNKLTGYNFWGTIDGSYILFLLQYGIIFAFMICILLAISNYLLCKKNNYLFYSILLSFEISAFSENVLQFYTLTFILIFSMCSLYPGWLKGETSNNVIEEI